LEQLYGVLPGCKACDAVSFRSLQQHFGHELLVQVLSVDLDVRLGERDITERGTRVDGEI
jgi:hypothetical protein